VGVHGYSQRQAQREVIYPLGVWVSTAAPRRVHLCYDLAVGTPRPVIKLKGERTLIVELRIYDVQPGKVPAYIELYEAQGLPIQQKYLGRLVGWYSANDFGVLNQVVHLWAYADLADRETRRARMLADPAWQSFLAKAAAMLLRMESKILREAPFFSLSETLKVPLGEGATY
jgi:hypothetical protein